MDERISTIGIRTIAGRLGDFLMPRVCVCCGTALFPDEESICLRCLSDLPLTHHWENSRNPMADCFNASVQASRYEYATALFFYRSGQPHAGITQSVKYRRNFASGRYFATLLAQKVLQCQWFADADAIVPVPLHWRRRLSRGYNQAEVIAARLSEVLGRKLGREIPLRKDLLRRSGFTKTQTRLNAEEKAANVRGAFTARLEGPCPKHILLVDDVFTTGATVSECHAALHSALGPDTRISVLTLAFVEGE